MTGSFFIMLSRESRKGLLERGTLRIQQNLFVFFLTFENERRKAPRLLQFAATTLTVVVVVVVVVDDDGE